MPPDALHEQTLIRAREERTAAIADVQRLLRTQIRTTWLEDWETQHFSPTCLPGASGTVVPPGVKHPVPTSYPHQNMNSSMSVHMSQGGRGEVVDDFFQEEEEVGGEEAEWEEMVYGTQELEDDSDLLREADRYVVANPPPLPPAVVGGGDGGDGAGGNGVFKYRSPDEITPKRIFAPTRNPAVRYLRRRNRRLLREEMEWNKGLEMWVYRRRDWTAHNTDGGGGAGKPKSLFVNSPLTAAITPAAYPAIYAKCVQKNAPPVVPIGLADMTRALVMGWKRDGEWPSGGGAAAAVGMGGGKTVGKELEGLKKAGPGRVYEMIVRTSGGAEGESGKGTDGKGGDGKGEGRGKGNGGRRPPRGPGGQGGGFLGML